MSEIVDWHIETVRTLVRPAVVGDVADLHASRGQMPFDPQKRTLAQTRRLIASMDKRPVRAVAPSARGHGYAAEAVGALVDYLFARGRHRLIALTDMRNVPTHRLLEKLRFRREGVYLQSWAEDGKWYDEVGYARLAGE